MSKLPPESQPFEDLSSLLEQVKKQIPTSSSASGPAAEMMALIPELLSQFEKQARDLETVRKEKVDTQQRLKASQAQLVQSGKMAAVGQLAAGVAHEVNNALQIILSSVQLLMMRNRESDALVKDLQLIESNVKRISRIIRSLLDFARHNSEEEEWKEINLGHLVTQTSNLMQHLLEKAEIELHLILPEDEIPKIQGNIGEIEQVFLNLLINAQQATTTGGRIEIEILVSDEMVTALVRDTGEGISKDNLARIFEPFFTTREAQGGTGLGLSIIYGIIDKHNGVIDVESQENEGTTFTLRFPIQIDES